MSRTIKKYGNRKLYDPSESRYVSLSELREMIRSGETVEVVDSKSGRDITREVLTKAIVEQSDEKSLSANTLHALIRWGADTFETGLALFGKSVHKVLPVADSADVDQLLSKIKDLEEKVDDLQQRVDDDNRKADG